MKLPNSLRWNPKFHCVTIGGSKSNAVGLSASVGAGSLVALEADRSCSRPHATDEFRTPGAFAIMSNTMLPCGRS